MPALAKPKTLYMDFPVVWAKDGAFQIQGKAVAAPPEWKAEAEADTDILIGYASTFGGPPDLGGDIVAKGAFLKTIAERVPAARVPLTDGHQYDGQHIIGLILEAREDDHGLLIKARFSKVDDAQKIKTKVLEGSISGLSIGWWPIEVDFARWEGPGEWKGEVIRILKEVRLDEVALTALPMNENCRVLMVKSLAFQALPLAPASHVWNAEEAAARVKSWAKAEGKPNARVCKAYMGIELKRALEGVDACAHLIADVVDGELKAVPHAIFERAAAALDARITGKDAGRFPDLVLTHLEEYLSMCGVAAPWKAKDLKSAIHEAEKLLEVSRAKSAGPGKVPPTKSAEDMEREARMAKAGAAFQTPVTGRPGATDEERMARFEKARLELSAT